MSNTPVQEPPVQELSSGSEHTLPSRPFQPISDPSASKRVCFYRSGDYTFSGHRMVVNGRTFKTFDALLDALSKKVPLPFGVRTITTPRGTHLVKALDDLHDGGSYVCSDQRRVKPLNLDEVNRRQVPWNTTRPLSAGRRRGPQFVRRNEVATNRPAKVTERVAVRTPKRLVVIRNRDPNVKRTIVLQRRTAPTFDALLDYLSQILQFPVLKLFSTDGRRIDGLAGLILCSGVVVAAGNEPFRLGNYRFQGVGQVAQVMYMDTVEPSMLQPRTQNNKSLSSGRGSRNFSLSSERYIVNQINNSRNGSMNGHHHDGSFETEVNHHRSTSVGMRGTGRAANERHACIVPQDDDIEKSFRVNQDGSMTVEMKVRLTLKEEEMLHWTTTLSRSSLSKGTVCASISESGNSSPDTNNAIAKDSSSISEDETKEDNTSTSLGKPKNKRAPTPGPRRVAKKASVESVKTVTESGVQESTLGHYSYMERTADGETTEGYCVVRHSSSNSNRPVPKPRKTASAGASKKDSHSSIRSSGVAEVLQIQNNGMEVTETVMHIFENQGCYDNYFANKEYSADSVALHGSTPAPESKPSTDSGRRSSSNDIDFSWQPPTTGSLQRQKEEMLSLSSEPVTQLCEITAANSQIQETVKKDKTPKSETKKKRIKPARNLKSSTSTSSSDKKQKDNIVSPPKNSNNSSTDKLSSNASVGKKNLSSSESAKRGQKSRRAENPQIKKVSKDEKTSRTEQALIADTENVRRTPPKRQNTSKAVAKDNGHNVNTPTVRPQMKKNISDILQPKKSLLIGKKSTSKPKSMTENRTPSSKKSLELSGSSMPALNPSPSEIHQYVENWLEKVSPDPVPYTEEATAEPQTKVVFQIGGGSDTDEKSECQTHLDECYPSPGDAVSKTACCLSVPHCQEATAVLHNEQYVRGLCVSMPSVRVGAVQQENRLRPHKSAEAIGPADNESPSFPSDVSDPNVKHVLRDLYASIHCIRSASETNTTSNLEKSNSLPDFSKQVASVFGSSCKAFMSFLSVMTLRDNLAGMALGGSNQSRSTSEAMLMMESLQKISAIEDEEELRASLTDLQSRTSSQLRECWKDFQTLRERLESEPLSPKVSETEFALDVISEGGDVFADIDELMDELNMPEDLRAEISSTIQQAKSFYPVEESTIIETERNQSDSEEDVEQFVEECDVETKQSPESETSCMAEDITQIHQDDDNGEIDNLKKMQSVYYEQARTMTESEQEPDKQEEDKGEEEEVEEVEEDREVVNNDGDDGEETEKGEREREEETEEGAVTEMDDKGQEEAEVVKGSVEEEESVQEVEERTEDEEEKIEEAEEGLMGGEAQEVREDDSVEETDKGEGVEEGEDEVDEEEKRDEWVTEERQPVETEGKADEVAGETDEEEEVGKTEEAEEEEEEQADEVAGETDEEEEIGKTEEVEEEEEEQADEVAGETDGGEEIGKTEEVEEEEEEQADEVAGETDGGEEIGKTEEVEKEEAADVFTKDVEEEVEEDIEATEEESNEEEDVENIIEEMEEEEETDAITDKDVEEGVIEEKNEEDEEYVEEKDEEQDKTEVVSEENNEEEEHREEEVVNDSEDDEVVNIEERMVTDEEEEGEDTDKNIEEEEKRDGGEEELVKAVNSVEEESEEDKEVLEEIGEIMKAGRKLDEEERKDDDEENESDDLNEGLDEVKEQESKEEVEEENATDDADSIAGGKNLLEEASYLQQQSSCDEANVDAKVAERRSESSTKHSPECQCEDDKGNGTDTVNELETDEGGEPHEEGSSSVQHPVEISQELLDYVNSALQSSSLIFTYDARGNIRIEPDYARVTQTAHTMVPKSRKDMSYSLKRLPSPSTSDLSDYRPETSESGGYKTQESVDIVTESGEEASPVCWRKTDMPNERANVEGANPKLSVASNTEVSHTSPLKSGGSFSSSESGTKASKEDLSYFSAASSQKADAEPATEATQCFSFTPEDDGVLIDQGRWLLKENHLIRKSPPVSMGMYGQLDSTSTDTGQDNEDSPSHCKTQKNPLAAISSSELEEMAKPQTPKCTYYNMSHGSDSDPFLDDSSDKSGKRDASSFKVRGFRVSPTVDTSKTWANKNGSLSSFASVEFKIPDGKVHPEGESSAVTRARRASSGGRNVLQAQDSRETLHVRCGQYCPIL